jgi:hypothetical protein
VLPKVVGHVFAKLGFFGFVFFYLLNSTIVLQAKHLYLHDIGMLCLVPIVQLQWFMFA